MGDGTIFFFAYRRGRRSPVRSGHNKRKVRGFATFSTKLKTKFTTKIVLLIFKNGCNGFDRFKWAGRFLYAASTGVMELGFGDTHQRSERGIHGVFVWEVPRHIRGEQNEVSSFLEALRVLAPHAALHLGQVVLRAHLVVHFSVTDFLHNVFALVGLPFSR
jgi:hypothetical protein